MWENRQAQEVLLDLQAGMKRQASWWLKEPQGDEGAASDEEFPLDVVCEAHVVEDDEDEDELLPPPPPSGDDAEDVITEALHTTKKRSQPTQRYSKIALLYDKILSRSYRRRRVRSGCAAHQSF